MSWSKGSVVSHNGVNAAVGGVQIGVGLASVPWTTALVAPGVIAHGGFVVPKADQAVCACYWLDAPSQLKRTGRM